MSSKDDLYHLRSSLIDIGITLGNMSDKMGKIAMTLEKIDEHLAQIQVCLRR